MGTFGLLAGGTFATASARSSIIWTSAFSSMPRNESS